MKTDDYFMAVAIEEAKKGLEKTHPNPIVGAVIVENDEIVAKGFHEKAGELHAEKAAMKNLGRKSLRETVMYVTMEPCSTEGQTGKCTEAIIESGISKVIIGTIDPNPDHQGQGFRILTQAGIKVQTGVLEEECKALNPDFNKRMTEKLN